MRIVLIMLALVLLGVAALAGLNLRAATLGSQAAAALSSNLSAASRSDPDLSSLLVQQEQTDARFDDALTASGAILPAVRNTIESNASTSRRLTSLIRDAINGSSSDAGSSSTSSPSASASASSSPSPSSSASASTTSGLTEKQRQEIERMLSSSSASASATSSTTSPSSTSSSTTKPW